MDNQKDSKPIFLFCTGLSGSGKSYFVKNILPQIAPNHDFYNLKSATTRPMRDGEKDGREYYFREEPYFYTEKFATFLWVNKAFWNRKKPKWLYGVPEFEIMNNLGRDFTYDVIQPRYIRQMINWFTVKLNNQYDFKILWFQPPENSTEIVQKRQNMPNDSDVRAKNTCNLSDFTMANLTPDHKIISNPQQLYIDEELRNYLGR